MISRVVIINSEQNPQPLNVSEGIWTPVLQGKSLELFPSLKMGENFPLEFLKLQLPFVWVASEACGLNPICDSYGLLHWSNTLTPMFLFWKYYQFYIKLSAFLLHRIYCMNDPAYKFNLSFFERLKTAFQPDTDLLRLFYLSNGQCWHVLKEAEKTMTK